MPEDDTLHGHRHENLKSYTIVFSYIMLHCVFFLLLASKRW
jgi:hypothetical protein